MQGLTKFFAAYKQISLMGSVPTKFTINSTTNWGLCLQAALACLPTLSGPESIWYINDVKTVLLDGSIIQINIILILI